ncbi:MAG: hypothetical protein NTV79_09280 [Candidatus Aureabacteria bacterium]|nr:hypothetical protein [Candidatus Auribacterota bacterium]
MKAAIRTIRKAFPRISALWLAGAFAAAAAPAASIAPQTGAEAPADFSRSVITVEERAGGPAGEGVETGPGEKKVYLLKLDTGEVPRSELLTLQKRMLQNQLVVLKVLGVIVKHQDALSQRLARSENVSRELLSGMKDAGYGVDMTRADVAGTSARTADIAEMSRQISDDIEDIQDQLSDIEAEIGDLAGTADEILDVAKELQGALSQ